MSSLDKVKTEQLEILHRDGLIKVLKLIENNANDVNDQALREEYRVILDKIDDFFFKYTEYDSNCGGMFDGVQSILRDVGIFHELGEFIYQDRFKCQDCGRDELDVILKIDGNGYAITCRRCGFSWKT